MPKDDINTSSFEPGTERPGRAVDQHRVQRALLAGWRWIIGALVVGTVLGYVAAKLMPSSPYTTSALLKYEGGPEGQRSGLLSPGSLGAASQALNVQPVLEAIRERTGFQGGLTALAANIVYRADLSSSVIRIDVSADSAEGVAEFAKAVAEVFMEYHEQEQAKRIRAEIANIESRVASAEADVDKDRQAYSAFGEEHGIADVSAEQENSRESAAKMRARAELATSEVRALEAQVKALEQQLQQTSQTRVVTRGGSPELMQYRRLRTELAKARSSYSNEHPQVRSLERQVQALRQQLDSGSSDSIGVTTVATNTNYTTLQQQLRTTKANLEALRERQKGFAELAAKALQRIEAFSEFEGEASSLLTEIKVSEALVVDLRSTQAMLEDALRKPSSGFVIIDPGSVPEYAQRARAKYLAFAGVPLLFLFGALAFVVGREFRGLRVRTASEVGYWGHGPVVGSTTWPRDPDAVEDLVAGLDDYAPDSTGSLLIVGGSEREEDLACELASRLSNDWFSVTESGPPPGPAPAVQPIETPPQVQRYPLAIPTRQSTAIATRSPREIKIEAWVGPPKGQALRRAARLADRVVVLVHCGALSTMELSEMRTRLGRDDGIAYILVGLDDELLHLPDRTGNVDQFWKA